MYHFDSVKGLWLQGEAALQTHSFRDAEPQPWITPDAKKILECLQNMSDWADHT